MAGNPLVSLAISDAEIQAVLREDPFIRASLEAMAHKGIAFAQSISPVGSAPHDKHPGIYQASFGWEMHMTKTRMVLRIGNKDQKAWWIEYGAAHMPKFAVLRRMLDYLRSGSYNSAGSYSSAKGS